MTAIQTVHVGNFTPHERVEVVTTVISLPDGLMSATIAKDIVAVDPLGDGLDRSCEWYPLGPTRADGSYRKLRILFPCKVSGGIAKASRGDDIAHAFYRLRSVVIEARNTVPSIPTWTSHAEVDLSALDLEFGYSCSWDGYGPTPVRSAAFTAASGYVMQRDGSAASTARTEIDTGSTWGSTTGRWVRSWIVPVRILPELMGGTENEATFYCRMIIEQPTAAISGLGRSVKWWLEWGNSLVTSDDPADPSDPARDLTHSAYVLHDSPYLSVDGAMIAIYNGDAFMPSSAALAANNSTVQPVPVEGEPELASTAVTIPLLDHANPDGPRFNWGSQKVCFGQFYFATGTPSTLEATSWQAQSYGEGDQAWMDAVSGDWASHDNFGVFGVVFTRADGNWGSDAAMWAAASKLCLRDRQLYSTRDPWKTSIHGSGERPGFQGGQPDFGYIHHLPQAMAGFPDLRAARLSAVHEGGRMFAHRLIDGASFDYAAKKNGSGPASLPTHVVYYFCGRPKTKSDSYPSWAELLGKDNSAYNESDAPANPANWQDWAGTHISFNATLSYATLSGDRWFVHSALADYVNMAVCTFPSMVAEVTSEYTEIDVGMNSARAFGRGSHAFGHVWSLSGDIEIARKHLIRVGQVYDWNTGAVAKPSSIGGGATDLNLDMATFITNRPNQYFTNESWSVWLESMCASGVYAILRMVDSYTDADLPERTTLRPKLIDTLAKLSYAQAVYGYRKNAETNDLWDPFYAVDYEWNGPSNRGQALDSADGKWLTGTINPLTGEAYCRDTGPSILKWSLTGTALAPIFHPTDPVVRAAMDKLDPDWEAIFPPIPLRGESLTSYPYGFGRYGESWFSWCAVVPNFFEVYRGYSAGGSSGFNRSCSMSGEMTSAIGRSLVFNRDGTFDMSLSTAFTRGGNPTSRSSTMDASLTSSISRSIGRTRSADMSASMETVFVGEVVRGPGSTAGGSESESPPITKGADPRLSKVHLVRVSKDRVIRVKRGRR